MSDKEDISGFDQRERNRIRSAEIDAETAAAYYHRLIKLKVPEELAGQLLLTWATLTDD